MTRRFQFSLRALLVLPAIVAAFFAGEFYGRVREHQRMDRIHDIRAELIMYARDYRGSQRPPEVVREVEKLQEEWKALSR